MPIVFDGFSQETFEAIAHDADVPLELARLAFPKGMSDLGIAIHFAGDTALAENWPRGPH